MSNDSTRQHLIGTWKLIAAVREEISSGTKTEFLGPNPVGYINYGADGRMLVLTVGSGRRKPAGPKATSAEVEALFRSMTSYGGTYTIDGNEITPITSTSPGTRAGPAPIRSAPPVSTAIASISRRRLRSIRSPAR